MRKITALTLIIFAAFLFGGCDDLAEKREAEKRAGEAGRTLIEAQIALQEATAAGRKLIEARASVFQPSPEEMQRLNDGLAVSALGAPNGFFTNKDGVSGYFHGFDRPFNFIWTGGTSTIKAFDGRSYKALNGPGELIIKALDDALLWQRYIGQAKDGLLDGHGQLWLRNTAISGHAYYSYFGDFVHDSMEGSGVLTDYDFAGRGGLAFKYEGDMKYNHFHGHGRTLALGTDRLMRKGLWMFGDNFGGDEEAWKRKAADLEASWNKIQVINKLFTDEVEIEVLSVLNGRPAPLTFITPEDATGIKISDQSGHIYALGSVPHPRQTDAQGEKMKAYGFIEERPAELYPLTLTVAYTRQGLNHFARFTLNRPGTFLMKAENSLKLLSGEDVDEEITELLEDLTGN